MKGGARLLTSRLTVRFVLVGRASARAVVRQPLGRETWRAFHHTYCSLLSRLVSSLAPPATLNSLGSLFACSNASSGLRNIIMLNTGPKISSFTYF